VNLNGRTINPGELRTRIALQQRSVTQNAGGFQVEAWATATEVWARWENVHGSEVWAAQSTRAVQPATVLIRYRADVDETWRVLRAGLAFEIVSLDDIQNRHEYIELKVRRMAEG
jgi:SPP1 family predicted phage head-tail adaptor